MINHGVESLELVDIHYHANPDLFIRRHSVLEAGKIYQTVGGAVVLKSHIGSTSVAATIAQELGMMVFPSLVLNHNHSVSFKTILNALSNYKPIIPSYLLVHLPTIKKSAHRSKLVRNHAKPELKKYLEMPYALIHRNGRLKQNIKDILLFSKDHPVIISSGHASRQELLEILDYAQKINLDRFLLNQPDNPMTGLTNDEIIQWADSYEFIWVEQTALTYFLGYQSKEGFLKMLNHCLKLIYSSDLGQTSQMDILSWVEWSREFFASNKLPQKRIKEIWSLNPKKLLFPF